MPKLKPKTVIPTLEEDVIINAGIAADPDTYEMSAEEFKQLKPVGRGRPKAEVTKRSISIRLSDEVIESFKADGPGWQTRIDEVLKDYVQKHKAA